MSPTRRQLLAGIASLVATGAVAGGIAASDTDTSNAHHHSIGRYETHEGEPETNEALDLVARIEDATLLVVAIHPDTGRMVALQLKARGEGLSTWSAWRAGEIERDSPFTPSMASLPTWIAQPLGELFIETEATS